MHTQKAHLDRLEAQIREMMVQVRQEMAHLDEATLRKRPNTSPKAWNVLECLAHLNSYSEYYIPKFELSIHKAKARKWTPAEFMESTWLGRYSVRSVDPDAAKPTRMRSPKTHNYFEKDLKTDEVKSFLVHQERLLRIISQAREVDLNRAKAGLSIFPALKMRLGDFLEFLVAHERRHLAQAMRCLEKTEI